MLLRNLTKVWISEYEEINDHGEKTKQWFYKGQKATVNYINEATVEEINNITIDDLCGDSSVVYMNLQQDINELDRKSNGEINYDIYKARTDKDYKIKNGCGISLIDISELEDFKPEYRVIDQQKIGNCIVYRLERYYGD